MMNPTQHQITIFGQPDFDATGNFIYPKLVKQTLRPSRYYPLFTRLCSRRRLEPFPWNRCSKDVATAWLMRERRAIDFADATGLSQHPKKQRQSEALYARVRKVVKVDHPSIWVSPTGALFLLNELYDSWNENQQIFSKAGLLQIRVPAYLAPWGGIDHCDGQEPEGRSYLYCDASGHLKIAAIEGCLNAAALTAPSFDDTSGISYV